MTARNRTRTPAALRIILTAFDDWDKLSKSVLAGASDYLLRNEDEEAFAAAAKQVL